VQRYAAFAEALALEIGAHYVGWIVTLSIVALCTLHESGKLLEIRRHIALWLLETSNPEVRAPEDLQPERENAA
jgi:hypothetical protein